MKKEKCKSFMKFPRALIESPDFFGLSSSSKLLLALILDRIGVSENNAEKFTDKYGNLFVVFTIEEISRKLNCSKATATRTLTELYNNGLITKYRDACGKPQKIIVTDLAYSLLEKVCSNDKNDTSVSKKVIPDRYKNDTSVSKKIIPAEVSELGFSYNNNSNNKLSNNKSSIIGFEKTEDEIREQIEYDFLVCDENQKLLDEIVMIISDVVNGTSPTVRVGKDSMPRGLVVARFCKLNSDHIFYVLSNIENSTQKIKHIKAYLITMLYNAPATMESELTAVFSYYHKS